MSQNESVASAWPWPVNALASSFATNHDCLAIEYKQVLSGYLVALQTSREVELLNIVIFADLQNRGVGQMVVKHWLKQLENTSIERVYLEVRSSNVAAIRVYQNCNFTLVGTRKAYYPKGHAQREDALLMARVLNPYEECG